MRITYDPQADALFIQLNSRPRDGAVPVGDSLIIRYAEDDSIAGIELLDVSKHADNVDELIEKYHIDKVLAAERAATKAE